MNKNFVLKLLSIGCVLGLLLSFSACSSGETSSDTKAPSKSASSSSEGKTPIEQAPVPESPEPQSEKSVNLSTDENIKIYGMEPDPEDNNKSQKIENPVTSPRVESKEQTPDLESTQVRAASASVLPTGTEDAFVEALEAYANPNGNEYDAISVLGRFRYTDDEATLMQRFKTASDQWHNDVKTQVGEKCTVDITIKENTAVSLSDTKVTQWNAANGKTAESYANLKCVISTNYATSTVTLSVDIVKVDGNWHAANTNVIDNLKKAITTHIFK